MKKNERKWNLVQTALRLFKKKGYENVTVDEICAAVGITKPTFYNHVGRKEMIFVEFFHNKEEMFLPSARKYLSIGRPAAAFQSLFTGFHTIAMEMGPELLCVYMNYILKNPAYADTFNREHLELIESSLRKLQELDIISSRQAPEDLALMMLQLNDGLMTLWAGRKGSFHLVEMFQNWSRLLLGVNRIPKGVLPEDESELLYSSPLDPLKPLDEDRSESSEPSK